WFGGKGMYDRAGFVEVARREPTRPVVHKALAEALIRLEQRSSSRRASARALGCRRARTGRTRRSRRAARGSARRARSPPAASKASTRTYATRWLVSHTVRRRCDPLRRTRATA